MRLRGWIGHRLPGNFYTGISVPLRFPRGRRHRRNFRYGKYPRVVWMRVPRQQQTRQKTDPRVWWVLGGLAVIGLVMQFWVWILIGLGVLTVLGLAFMGWRSRSTPV